MVTIDPNDITGSFNDIYATANIIAIEETFIEKKLAIEKIKSLSTGKFIVINQKYISKYKLPFFGHLIMTTNDTERFIKIDQEEIRFFIRKLGTPSQSNFGIEDDLVREIPAFLHHLIQLPALDYSRSRALFTPDEIKNDELAVVKEESKSWLWEEIKVRIENFFAENENVNSFFATPLDIKDKFFHADRQVTNRFIRKVLIDDFGFDQPKMVRYCPFEDAEKPTTVAKKPGTPFFFSRNGSGIPAVNENQPPELPF